MCKRLAELQLAVPSLYDTMRKPSGNGFDSTRLDTERAYTQARYDGFSLEGIDGNPDLTSASTIAAT
jgi:hypothetical protein